MSKERELLQRLVDSGVLGGYSFIAEVKELLAQHEQEPVAWLLSSKNSIYTELIKTEPEGTDMYLYTVTPLYTAPPNQKPLGDDWIKNNIHFAHQDVSFTDLVRAVEKAHGIGV